jgi:phenylacetate-coenzyme A ligase PaaK-like adenylate-forming protein
MVTTKTITKRRRVQDDLFCIKKWCLDIPVVRAISLSNVEANDVVRIGHFPVTGHAKVFTNEENLTKFSLEVERDVESKENDSDLSILLSKQIKVRLGLKPKSVIIHPHGILPRETHKAKRVVDLRKTPELTLV